MSCGNVERGIICAQDMRWTHLWDVQKSTTFIIIIWWWIFFPRLIHDMSYFLPRQYQTKSDADAEADADQTRYCPSRHVIWTLAHHLCCVKLAWHPCCCRRRVIPSSSSLVGGVRLSRISHRMHSAYAGICIKGIVLTQSPYHLTYDHPIFSF